MGPSWHSLATLPPTGRITIAAGGPRNHGPERVRASSPGTTAKKQRMGCRQHHWPRGSCLSPMCLWREGKLRVSGTPCVQQLVVLARPRGRGPRRPSSLASSPPLVNHTPHTGAPKASPQPSPGCPPGRQHSPPCTALSYPWPLSPACLSRTHMMCTALSELSTKGQHPRSFWQDGCPRTSPEVVARPPDREVGTVLPSRGPLYPGRALTSIRSKRVV